MGEKSKHFEAPEHALRFPQRVAKMLIEASRSHPNARRLTSLSQKPVTVSARADTHRCSCASLVATLGLHLRTPLKPHQANPKPLNLLRPWEAAVTGKTGAALRFKVVGFGISV